MYVTEMINTCNLAKFVLTAQHIDSDRTIVIFRTESYQEYEYVCEKLGDVPMSASEYFH